MQLIAEAYDILGRGLGLGDDEISDIFTKWNKGVLDSFLIEITANILKFKDDDGEPVIHKILDKAGQKGTGKWTAIAALDAGTPGSSILLFGEISDYCLVTLIGEAVFARCLSSIKEERVRASKVLYGPQKEPFRGDKQQFIDDLEQALYASKIISYTQGFMLMRETAKEVITPLFRQKCLDPHVIDWMESQLCRDSQDVARRLHHQGKLFRKNSNLLFKNSFRAYS